MAKRTAMAIMALPLAAWVGCERGSTRTDRAASDNQASEMCPAEPSAKIRSVLRYLHRAHQAEVNAGNLAALRSLAPEVREFGKQMVTEHIRADRELEDLSRREHIDLTSVLPADPIHAALQEALTDQERTMQTLSSAAFDGAYVGSQVAEHAIFLKAVEEAQKVATGDIKTLLEQAHQMAGAHHDHALLLMQDLHFAARAIGGGPASMDDPSHRSSMPRSIDLDVPAEESSIPLPDPGSLPRARDAGTWPPITTPPERMP
jgi:predicted outer membrane protein